MTEQPRTESFYREALCALNASGVPCLVGGAYALERYTGVMRATKDLDVFVRRRDIGEHFKALEAIGCRTEIAFPHWLGKAHRDGDLVDLIYSSGNGVAVVDDEWFRHATDAELLGVPVRLCPVEEMIWSKGFIMERERFDGADILHLILARAGHISWERLLARFGPQHWPVLLVHLILFAFAYPGSRELVPAAVMNELRARLGRQAGEAVVDPRVCRGSLLSRAQYLVDVEDWGLQDARLGPETAMTAEELAPWTDAVAPEVRPRSTRGG